MVFKGTPRRSAADVNREFDRIGADYNAFTSEENTVFHASVLPEYLPQAFDVLAGPRQRFGHHDNKIKQALTNRHVVWFHAVSVGEMNICVQICRALEILTASI